MEKNMQQDKNSFTHLSLQNRKSIASVLKEVIKGLEKGEITFTDDKDEITLKPQGLLRLKVSASNAENSHKLNFKISWHVTEEKLENKKILSVK